MFGHYDDKSPTAPPSYSTSAGGDYGRVTQALSKVHASHTLPAFKADDMTDEAVDLLSQQPGSDFRKGLERLGLSMGEALKFSTSWEKPSSTSNVSVLISAVHSSNESAAKQSSSSLSATQNKEDVEQASLAIGPLPKRRSWFPSRFAWAYSKLLFLEEGSRKIFLGVFGTGVFEI